MSFNIALEGEASKSAGASGSTGARFMHPPAARPSSGLLPHDMPSSRAGTTLGQVRPTTADYGNDTHTSAASGVSNSSERLYGSPRRKRQRINADRYVKCYLLSFEEKMLTLSFSFIPARSGRDLQSGFHLIPPPPRPTPERGRPRSPPRGYRSQKSESALLFLV